MAERFGSGIGSISKAQFLADAVNKALQNVIIECTKDIDDVRDYFSIALIVYGDRLGSALSDMFAGRDYIPVSELAEKPVRVEERTQKLPDGVGGVVELPVRFPLWFEPSAAGGTPMCAALERAHQVLSRWVVEHPQGFPPVVLHFTDGESTDGDPRALAANLRDLKTSDGNVLLLTCHISSKGADMVAFPISEAELPPDPNARILYEMSSVLPDTMVQIARDRGHGIEQGARGFIFNGGIEQIVTFLDIGTRPATLR